MIKVGCCGFPVKRETYYQHFSVVEIQQTFYQLPRVDTGKKWKEEAPSNFEFTMKAWQLITHEPSSPTYRRLRMAIPEKKKRGYGFFKGTEEVAEAWWKTAEFAKALGVGKIVFQSPASFCPSDDHIKNLKKFFKKIKTHPFVPIWEPRGEWEGGDVKRLCKELEIIPCLDPFEETSIQGDLLYTRLHGREGYRYAYSEVEMKQLIEIGKLVPQPYFMFNNVKMYEDAQRFKKLLESWRSRFME
jgi:uncharacterized protein YecE (DUF72 family)